MKAEDLIYQRLHNQQVIDSSINSAEALISWFGAMQAQDYAMAKWAIGVRLKNITDQQIEEEINKAKIIRTHILRPTWHFVAAKDLKWMMQLSSPRVSTILKSYSKKVELTAEIHNKANELIINLLSGYKHLTREEIMVHLNENGIDTNELRSTHIMMHAELNGIVCNGIRRGKQFTYALMDEWITENRELNYDESLAELAKKYFQSHSPATLQDFVWWSGLTSADAKKAIDFNKNWLIEEKLNDKTYYRNHFEKPNHKIESVIALPAYDEFLISYTDRSMVLEASHGVISGNGIFKPIILKNGMVVGTWGRTISKNKVSFNKELFDSLNDEDLVELEKSFGKYVQFLNNE